MQVDSSIILDVDLIPHLAYCKLIQKGDQYVKGKIKDGKWTEGVQYFKDPDGQIWVSLNGIEQWVKSNIQQGSDRQALASKSASHGRSSGMNPSGRSPRQRRISKPPSVSALI